MAFKHLTVAEVLRQRGEAKKQFLSLERILEVEDSVQEQLLKGEQAVVPLAPQSEAEAVRKHLEKGGFVVNTREGSLLVTLPGKPPTLLSRIEDLIYAHHREAAGFYILFCFSLILIYALLDLRHS